MVEGRIFISYERNARPDDSLAKRLYTALSQAGHRVFIDQTIKIGLEWAREIERPLETSDFLRVLLSEASVNSEMVAKEVEYVRPHYQRTGRARLLPVPQLLIDSPPTPMLQYYQAGVAQLAEQLFCKQQVVGSIPTTGSSEQGFLMRRTSDHHWSVLSLLWVMDAKMDA